MQFISIEFLLFFFIISTVYYLIPGRFRYIWLLAAGMCFYALIDLKALPVLLSVILITYAVSLKVRGSRKVLALGLVLIIGILGYFKYLGFLSSTIVSLARFLGLSASDRALSVILPVGISFYVFEAAGYLIDCYRGKNPERNILRIALFLSFFPTVQSGPIEREGNLSGQFREGQPFRFDNVRQGLLMMLWGAFMKLVLADRLVMIPDHVYADPARYSGGILFLASLAYTLQIYCDFAGYSNMAIGAARVLGIRIMDNFQTPYFSESVAEFWRRWHISLSRWFRDYLYIPLGGNRKGTLRKMINILIVFAVSGLWHAAAWTFVAWGLLHGLYQVAGSVLMPLRDGLVDLFHVDRSVFSHRLLKRITTFLLVNFAWIFFRAGTFGTARSIISGMFGGNSAAVSGSFPSLLGLDTPDLIIAAAALLLLFVKDIANYNHIGIRQKLMGQGIWLRWTVYILLILIVLTFGLWGPGYNAESFIYSQF